MLRTAVDRQAKSAALASRAAQEARRAQSVGGAGLVVARYQAANATLAQVSVTAMLAEQGLDAPPDGLLNALAFTTASQILEQMLASAGDARQDRLIASLVQDAGRAAETVTVAARRRIGWVRHLNLPSCSRCVVLAGRVYRYSDGFERHPGDDCTTLPVREGDEQHVADPVGLLRRGLVRGLSEADTDAVLMGADFSQVVNVRTRRAGLTVAGRVLARRGRPTPEGILRAASSREHALELLQRAGYLLP